MDAGTFLIDFLISLGVTLVVILTPYIITRIATHGNIQFKTAKILTAVYSIVSFVIFCIIFFLLEQSKVSILPIVVWNAMGYFIIRPKTNTSEVKESGTVESIKVNDSSEIESEVKNAAEINPDDKKSLSIKGKHIVKVKVKKSEESDNSPKESSTKSPFKTATIILAITTVIFAISTASVSVSLNMQKVENEELAAENSKLVDTNLRLNDKVRELNDKVDELLSKAHNSGNIDWNALNERAKEDDSEQLEKEKNSQKPDLNTNWQ